jgi:hypothetical protein
MMASALRRLERHSFQPLKGVLTPKPAVRLEWLVWAVEALLLQLGQPCSSIIQIDLEDHSLNMGDCRMLHNTLILITFHDVSAYKFLTIVPASTVTKQILFANFVYPL